MNAVDLAVLGVLAVSALVGLLRGMVREVLGVGAWAVAALVASPYGVFPAVAPFARAHITEPTVADAVAFGVVFIVVLGVLLLLVGWAASRVRTSALGGLDRTLGVLFGAARGIVLLAAAYIVMGLAVTTEQWPAPLLEARSLPLIHAGAERLASALPAPYRPSVIALPAGRVTRAEDLLRATPSGRATGVKPLGSQAARE